MKSIFVFFLVLFLCVSAGAQTKSDLVGLGMNGELASKLMGAPYIATPAATPVAGVNDVKGRVVVIPTAAANAAVLLKATPKAGDTHLIFNTGPNATRLKAGGAGTINGSAAGAYIPLATKQMVECTNRDGTDWFCNTNTVPTPAGP